MDEVEIKAFGRVQGIRFRQFVKDFALKNSIKGFVKNRDDGSVLIIAQAEKKRLDKLLSWIQGSPGISNISGLDFHFYNPKQNYLDFKIIKEKSFLLDQVNSFVNLGKSFAASETIPRHIVIIPDGNRRWAKEKGMDPRSGHYKAGSYDNLESLFVEAKKLGVKYFSIWGFSTENWKRNPAEVKAIFSLIMEGLERFRKDAYKNKIRFRHLGRKDRLPKKLVLELKKLEEETKDYGDFNVQLCLDYGGRDELVRAVNSLLKSKVKKINEKDIEKYLDSNGIPDPDLIIRTSGEKRTSGFMPYQSVYAELYFSDLYFPDFNALELRKAVKEYARRNRRFGGS